MVECCVYGVCNGLCPCYVWFARVIGQRFPEVSSGKEGNL